VVSSYVRGWELRSQERTSSHHFKRSKVSEKQSGEARLNDNQRRHYEILFSRLEQSLEQIERAIQRAPSSAQLTRPIEDLPESFVANAAPLIGELRVAMLDVVSTLGLRPREVSRRRTIQALISSEMNGVQDGYSSRLRGYGEVDPSVAEHLDPRLRRLHHGLAELGQLLRNSG
jgi:hypothetical protein